MRPGGRSASSAVGDGAVPQKRPRDGPAAPGGPVLDPGRGAGARALGAALEEVDARSPAAALPRARRTPLLAHPGRQAEDDLLRVRQIRGVPVEVVDDPAPP